MKLYQRTAIVCTGFSAVGFVGNLIFAVNPDHVLNLVELGILVVLFGITFFLRAGVACVLQSLGLFAGAFIAGAVGSFAPAVVLGTAAVVFVYTFSRFQPLPWWVLFGVLSIQFIGVTFAAIRIGYTELVAVAYGFMWTVIPIIAIWLLWQVLVEFAEKMIAQNRELLEINKKLIGGHNGPQGQ